MRFSHIAFALTFSCFALSARLVSARSRQVKQDVLTPEEEKSMLKTIRKLAEEAGHKNPKSIGKNRADGVCYSKKCLQTSIEFLEAMNFKADPCDPESFGKFSCERRLHRQPDDVHQSQIGNISQPIFTINSAQEKTKLFLDEPISKKDTPSLRNAKVALQQCKIQGELQPQATADLYQISQSYGGWPLLKNTRPTFWPSNLYDTLGFISQFQTISLFFEVQSFKTGKGHEIILDKGFIVQFQDQNELYQKYYNLIATVRQHVNELGIESGIELPSEELLSEKVQQVIKTRNEFRKAANLGLGKSRTRMTIAELGEFTYSFQWLNFFEKAFEYTHVKITPDTVVHVNKAYIKSIISLLVASDSTNIANLLQHELWSILKYATTIAPQKSLSEKECYFGVFSVFGASLSKEFLKRTDFPRTPEVDQDIESMMELIQKSLVEDIKASPVLTNYTKNHLVDKFENIGKYLGYAKWLNDGRKLRYYHDKLDELELNDTSYLKNMMAMAAWQVGIARDGMEKEIDNIHFWELNSFVVDSNGANYHKLGNALRIPHPFSSPPVYNVGVPGFVRYGGLGTVMAHELGHGLDTGGVYFDKNGNVDLTSFWDNQSIQEYNKWTEEIKKSFRGAKIHYHGPWSKGISEKLNPNVTINDDIADVIGLAVAFKAYKKWVSEQPGQKDMQLPGLEQWTGEQLFYVKFSNMWCSEMNEEQAKNVWAQNHSPDYNRATVPLKHSKQFSETFGCDFKKLSAF